MPKDFPGLVAGEVYLNPLFIKNRQDLDLMLVHGVCTFWAMTTRRRMIELKWIKRNKDFFSDFSSSETNFIV